MSSTVTSSANRRRATAFWGAALLAMVLGIGGMAAAPGSATAAQPAADLPEERSLSAITRGGRLYDNWFKELNETPPDTPHPAWPVDDPAAAGVPASATWTCSTCHGWDYRGRKEPSFPGITGRTGDDPDSIVAILTDATHGYGDMLHIRELADLARFVVWGQSHLIADLDPVTGTYRSGPGTAEGAVYHTVCARCHGGDGKQIEAIPPLGDLARENPWMVMHNILNGHAGGMMPSLRAMSEGVAVDTLGALQALPRREPAAAVARGGRLYSDWPRETGRAAPPGPHPAWQGATPANAATTWRCRDCHGWDYAGRDGAASAVTRAPAGPLPIAATDDETGGMTEDAVIATLTGATHGYGNLLTRRDLEDLAAFVASGLFPMDWVIDPDNGQFRSAGVGYADHYETLCASCHGTTGAAVRTMSPLGRVVRENPWRSLHSVLNGHAGESMPPMRVFPADMASAILAYIQKHLPTER